MSVKFESVTMTSTPLVIRHRLAGRLRLGIRALHSRSAVGQELSAALMALGGILYLRVNEGCHSLLVRYDPRALGEEAILAAVRTCLGLPAPVEATTCENARCSVCRARPDIPSVALGQRWRRFTLLSCVMGGYAVLRLAGVAVGGAALSPLGLVALAASWPLARRTVADIRSRSVTLESFLGGATVAAIVAGEALTALEILWITSGADLLKAWVTERSRRSIAAILEMTTHHTFVLRDGVEVEISVADVRPGDVVVVHSGEKMPVDGPVLRGEALVDEAAITGRGDPVHKFVGEDVLAGTLVVHGVIFVTAECVGDATYLARIISMVEGSLAHRAPLEESADRLARRLITLGFYATAGTFLFTGSLLRAFAVMLVMACPCATSLAASTAVSAGLSAAAKRNILIKGGKFLEAIGEADTYCFDKTGTLTSTLPVVEVVQPVKDATPEDMLRLAAAAEAHNHHPMAAAVLQAARGRNLPQDHHDTCEYFMGMGVRAYVHGRQVLVGSHKLMGRFGVPLDDAMASAQELKARGLTVLFVARDGELLGLLGVDNQVRPEARAALAELADGHDIHLHLLTGDEEATARQLAERFSMDTCHSSLLPEDKARVVAKLKRLGSRVVMVGDGINDALALATADIGVAMGAGGSEAAIEAADIALVQDDLAGLVYVHNLSHQVHAVVYQNFWIATGSNLLGAAAGALGILSPVGAGLLHIVHTLGVLANSSRLLAYQGPDPRRRLPAAPSTPTENR